jgi:histidine triad (HIT) family protein
MSDCIFCKIINKQIPAKLVFENADVIAFNDIHPKAKVHVLVVPKKHIQSLAHQTPEDCQLMGALTQWLPMIAKQCGLDNGFRTIINTGAGGGQEVPHLHYHILGGPILSGL